MPAQHAPPRPSQLLVSALVPSERSSAPSHRLRATSSLLLFLSTLIPLPLFLRTANTCSVSAAAIHAPPLHDQREKEIESGRERKRECEQKERDANHALLLHVSILTVRLSQARRRRPTGRTRRRALPAYPQARRTRTYPRIRRPCLPRLPPTPGLRHGLLLSCLPWPGPPPLRAAAEETADGPLAAECRLCRSGLADEPVIAEGLLRARRELLCRMRPACRMCKEGFVIWREERAHVERRVCASGGAIRQTAVLC